MNGRFKRKIKRIFSALLIIYVIGGVALYFMQDMILFHPRSLSKEHRYLFDNAFEEVNILTGKDNLNIIKFKPGNHHKGIVLFYHGNMGNVEYYKKYPAFFLRNNYEIWMIDYPGFGKTTGERTEKIIDEQALLLYDLASKQTSGDSIILYGKSIGTGVTSYVASVRTCKQLILETPYYSIPSLAKHYFPIYPVNFMIRYAFPIHEYLKKVNAPILILHGTNDEVIPYRQSAWLKKEDPKIELVTIEKGRHNNLSSFKLFQTTLDSLLQH